MFHASQSTLKDATDSVAFFFFCAYLHGMYDFARLMRAIVLQGDRFVLKYVKI